MPTKISKREAVAIVPLASNSQLPSTATHFANVNAKKSVWWLDIAVEKFAAARYSDIDLLVVTADGNTIHHLRVPTAYVRDNISSFHVRVHNDKDFVSLELSSSVGNLFQDVRPRSKKLNFAQFLVASLPTTSSIASAHG